MTPVRCIALAIALAAPGAHAGQLLRGGPYTTPPCFSNHYILDTPCAASWEPASNGLSDPDVYVLQAEPGSATTLYAGGARGVFKSLDGGRNWALTGLDMNLYNIDATVPAAFVFGNRPVTFDADSIVTSIAIDSAHPRTMYAGTRAHGSAFFYQRRVYKSTDGAETWSDGAGPLISGIENIHSIAMAPADPATLYVCDFDDSMGDTWSPVVRSRDGGASWDYMPDVAYVVMNTLAVDPVDARTLYGGTFAYPPEYGGLPDGVLKSIDGGETWQPTGLTGPGISALAIAPTAPRTIYAATSSDSSRESRNRLFRSTDDGLTWTPADTALGDFPITAVAVDPADSGNVYAAAFGAGVAASFDGGTTWIRLNDGLADLFVRSLLVVPGTSRALYAGTRSGVYRLAE